MTGAYNKFVIVNGRAYEVKLSDIEPGFARVLIKSSEGEGDWHEAGRVRAIRFSYEWAASSNYGHGAAVCCATRKEAIRYVATACASAKLRDNSL